MIAETLKKLRAGKNLSDAEMKFAIGDIIDARATQAQIGAFLMGLSLQGETASEIAAAVQILRARGITVDAPANAVDCCGTGGDNSGSLNISTAVAFVAAGAGVTVAKHGNRAASSKSGTADVLEALGIKLDLTPEQASTALRDHRFAFLMAPTFQPALKPLAQLRRELGFRTLFNLTGPLLNPAGTKKQLVGVFDGRWVRPLADVLLKLGSEKAFVVHGSDGLDEITLSGETFCAMLQSGEVREGTLGPADFGLPYVETAQLQGGDANENAKSLLDLLNGVKSGYRDVVLANAAAVLMLAGSALDLRDGVKQARTAIDEGRALSVFTAYRDFTTRL